MGVRASNKKNSVTTATATAAAVVALAVLSAGAATPGEDEVHPGLNYGVDVSFPIHRRTSINYPWLPHNKRNDADAGNDVPTLYKNMPLQVLGDRQSVYASHLEGCREAYKATSQSSQCDVYEYDRILMNNRQPQSMENYTEVGFLKTRAPDKVIEIARDFWDKNHLNRKQEKWPPGNTYTNHWSSPTYMVSVDDKGLRGSGGKLKETIWNAAQQTLEDWTGEDLSPTSMYGIRVYTEGAVLLPHVDRLPLVASAMINVAQDVDEPWPCEIYDHDGVAHNVTLEPGDMLLFESHSILHGRPFPLKGRMYAMLFIHFEPTGHSLRHHSGDEDEAAKVAVDDVDEQYKKAAREGVGGQSASSGGLPPYVKRESPEEEHWLQLHPEGWKKPTVNYGYKRRTKDERTMAHEAAAEGDARKVDRILTQSRADSEKEVVTERDGRGWQPIHEGAAHGHRDVVELLVEHGADVNTRTEGGRGATPLHLAETKYGRLHPVVRYLKSLGALNIGPEL
eukprot:CAMPEP_0197440578 /NCGR_PEP_ID=MMETSP1175-20131217/7045_1 /TAXON_ID=1003142 /ORGANISM="Triceratium dubium, Strain CCMP147" /LENGTH=507 /DNA_ID=CAMNT_0042970713 /DNA_START=207 /DNA_END=1730 /DNA_ORIENTATION=+